MASNFNVGLHGYHHIAIPFIVFPQTPSPIIPTQPSRQRLVPIAVGIWLLLLQPSAFTSLVAAREQHAYPGFNVRLDLN